MSRDTGLYLLDRRDLPPVSAAWRAALSAPLRDRLDAMRSAHARRQSEDGLRLLAAAAVHDGWPIELGALTRRDGRLAMPGGPAISLSHAGDYAVCAVSAAGAIGVDIERIRPLRTLRVLRLLSLEENAAAEHDPAMFFTSWTAREAVIKATGLVGPRRLAAVRVEANAARLDHRRFRLSRPPAPDGYALCVATEAGDPAAIQDLSDVVRKNSAA